MSFFLLLNIHRPFRCLHGKTMTEIQLGPARQLRRDRYRVWVQRSKRRSLVIMIFFGFLNVSFRCVLTIWKIAPPSTRPLFLPVQIALHWVDAAIFQRQRSFSFFFRWAAHRIVLIIWLPISAVHGILAWGTPIDVRGIGSTKEPSGDENLGTTGFLQKKKKGLYFEPGAVSAHSNVIRKLSCMYSRFS